ncbi:MAG: DUF86 domain-containing protein [bacterium]
MQRDQTYLVDILDSCRLAIELVRQVTYEQFLEDVKLQLAVVKLFEIIGEAARSISAEVKERRPDIPWTKIVGMRNVLVHQYSRVNFAEVWETIQHDIPDLIGQIEPLVPPEE